MIIEQPAKWLRWLYPNAIWRMDPNEHAVYLTFDDGPIPESTPFLLDTLRRYDVKATFFVVGDNVAKFPDLYRHILDEGHCVGNHTYHHLGSFKHWAATYLIDTFKCQQVMGVSPYPKREEDSPADGIHTPSPFREGRGGALATSLFRPPHGWLRHSVYYWLSKEFRVVMWDLVTRDYSKWLTADDVYQNVRRYARNGSIITFHDSLKSIDKLHSALPRSIEWLQQQGYEFKTFL